MILNKSLEDFLKMPYGRDDVIILKDAILVKFGSVKAITYPVDGFFGMIETFVSASASSLEALIFHLINSGFLKYENGRYVFYYDTQRRFVNKQDVLNYVLSDFGAILGRKKALMSEECYKLLELAKYWNYEMSDKREISGDVYLIYERSKFLSKSSNLIYKSKSVFGRIYNGIKSHLLPITSLIFSGAITFYKNFY